LGNYSASDIIDLASGAKGKDAFGYRQEFENLSRLVKELDVQQERADVQQQWKEPRG